MMIWAGSAAKFLPVCLPAWLRAVNLFGSLGAAD